MSSWSTSLVANSNSILPCCLVGSMEHFTLTSTTLASEGPSGKGVELITFTLGFRRVLDFVLLLVAFESTAPSKSESVWLKSQLCHIFTASWPGPCQLLCCYQSRIFSRSPCMLLHNRLNSVAFSFFPHPTILTFPLTQSWYTHTHTHRKYSTHMYIAQDSLLRFYETALLHRLIQRYLHYSLMQFKRKKVAVVFWNLLLWQLFRVWLNSSLLKNLPCGT